MAKKDIYPFNVFHVRRINRKWYVVDCRDPFVEVVHSQLKTRSLANDVSNDLHCREMYYLNDRRYHLTS